MWPGLVGKGAGAEPAIDLETLLRLTAEAEVGGVRFELDIVRHAGYWLRGDGGEPVQALQHMCWDGCMFPNRVMTIRRLGAKS
jgi:hypothetical protein